VDGRMLADSGLKKVRVDINVTADTKTLFDIILTDELEADRSNDRPKRSKSEILEMIIRKGYRAWKQEHDKAT